MYKKVLVVGGGIAGLSTALHLCRKGHRVTVMEKQKGPIDRVCGEGILPFGVQILAEMGLDKAVREAGYPFRGLAYTCAERTVAGKFPDDQHGIGIDRGSLDAILRAACERESGFRLLEGCRFREDMASDYDRIIAADGIHSPTGKAFGKTSCFGKRLGMRLRLEVEPPDKVWVHFLEGMEIYLTPTHTNTLSVAFLVDRHPREPGGQFIEDCLDRFRQTFPQYAHLEPKDIATRGPIASKLHSRPENLHLIGDALNAFDPISGAGMSFALLCARTVAQNLDDPATYYKALQRSRHAIASVTHTILFFRGGGLRTRLMLRQLQLAGTCFDRILGLHNGRDTIFSLNPIHALGLLRPF